MAHKLLFEMCVELKQHNIKIPLEIINSLTLLHSYVLAKVQSVMLIKNLVANLLDIGCTKNRFIFIYNQHIKFPSILFIINKEVFL